MGRTVTFNQKEAIDKAMLLFWEKGYDATHITELLEVMNISRSTLYASFGDKDALFQLVLAHYQQQGATKRALLSQIPSAAEAFRQFFSVHIERCYRQDVPKSCLITNSALLIGHIDKAIEQVLQRDFEALQKAFEQTLERGKSSGEFAPTLDVPFVAYILLNMNHSLNIMSAYQQDQALAYRLVDHTLQQLLQ